MTVYICRFNIINKPLIHSILRNDDFGDQKDWSFYGKKAKNSKYLVKIGLEGHLGA